MFHAIDSHDPRAVCVHVRNVFGELGWADSASLVDRLFHDVEGAFAGRHRDYQAIDMRYHSLQHTLEATYCLVEIIAGRERAGATPGLGRRDAELALMSALLHDCGYLKHRGDSTGTGAKYTFVHEHRSCDFARQYLPALGVKPEEIEDVCAAISCTGPRHHIANHTFRLPVARLLAGILVTADYLAQMSAPDYPDKLEALYREFEEAYEHEGLTPEQRPYRNLHQLLATSGEFWNGFVRPMLDKEAGAVYRYLAHTGQPNSYLQAVEDNLAEIARRLSAGLVKV
ncbi:MAG: HD domain-containing protein [Opitutales bacterium]